MNIRKKISEMRMKRLQKKFDKIERLLHTTPEERKLINKAQKAIRKMKRLQKLRSFKPFDLKCVRWYEKRQVEIVNGKSKGASESPGDFAGGNAATA
jgi:hypothetical protein